MMRTAIPLALAAAGGLLPAQILPPAARPRLVVLCVVDQLPSWVYAQAEPHLAATGGFRRLARDGVTFPLCAFEHACTETGPGHATIGTGAPASAHGIVRNTWWSPTDGAKVYCVGDEAEALPDLPDGGGRGPGRLRAPTFAASLKAHIAGSKVVSVAWKDRAAILMAGADADVAAWIETRTGTLTTNRSWVDETPAWIAEFNEARVLDRWFGLIWEPSGPQAAYAGLVDDRNSEWVHQNGSLSRTLPQPLTGGKDEPTAAYYEQLYASPFGNSAVRLAAEAAVRDMELGLDDAPDLLCVGFSSTDLVGHYFGPESVEARDALLRLDAELAAFWRTLDERVGKGRWAVFLTSDHGVAPTPEHAKANGVAAGRGPIDAWVRSAAEKALRTAFVEPADGARLIAHVGEGAIYLDDATLASTGLVASRDEVARVAARAAAGVRGVLTAYATADVVDYDGSDPIRRALRYAVAPDRAGDVQIVQQPYWLNGGLPASHGTPHPYDREVVAFALGPGLPAGARLAAPITPGFGVGLLARMLGIPKPSAAPERIPPGLLVTR